MSFSLFLSAKKYSCTFISIFLILVLVIAMSKAAYAPKEISLSLTCGNTLFISSESKASSAAVSVSAQSAVLIECESGNVIFSKNSDTRLPMASTTKIMTALVVIESCNLSDTVKISKAACGIEGSSVYLREGEIFTVKELLYALMLASANDAATALALYVSGSEEAFADKMNEKASELGLSDTHFKNPHGLEDDEHYTTTKELALIAAHASKNEVFRSICSTKKIIIKRESKESARLLTNHNKMLSSYDGCFGIKTGFTKASGRCLVSGAERDGLSLIAVTLNAPDDWQDHKSMLDYGFSLYEKVTLLKAGELSLPLDLIGSLQSTVLCTNSSDIYAILPKGTPLPEFTVEMKRFEYAPVDKGECVGRIVYKYKGKIIAQSEIITSFCAEKR